MRHLPSENLRPQYFSAVEAVPPPARRLGRFVAALHSAASTFFVDDPVKRAYLRTSLLFGLSVLVTWIPSSLNRIYGWLEGHSPYQLHVATSAVLPLQGLWNALIFFISSWDVVRRCVAHRLGRRSWAMSGREAGEAVVNRAGGGPLTELEDDTATMGSDVELRSAGSAVPEGEPLKT